MSQENAAVVLAAFEHLNRGDVDSLIALCDEDFVMDMSERVFNPDTYPGRDEIRRFYDGVMSAWQSYHWEVEETRTVDDAVVAMLHCTGQGREGAPSVDWRVAWLWRFRGGRPVSLRFYRERASALYAVGLEEQAMSANLDLVRSILARWERGEMSLSAWADCADPEIEVTVVGGPEPSSHKSVANAAPAVDAFLSLWDEYRVEAEEYRELDDARVLVLTRQSGRGKGSGVTTEERRATLFHIRDGRITRRVNYWDRERALADLGLEGQAVSQENVKIVRSAIESDARPSDFERLAPLVEDASSAARDTQRAMSGENVELVRTIYAMVNKAYGSGEYGREDFAPLYHPDVVVRTSGILPADTELHGYDGVREYAAANTQAFESLFVEPGEYIDAGERVLVPIRFGGEARDTGIKTTLYFVHVWTIRDGKVAELVIYRRHEDAAEAVRLAEQAMSANLDLVRSIYAEWEQGHLFNQDAWAHPDIEFEERDGPEPTHLKGIEALKENFRDFMDAWAGWRVEAEAYRELDRERVLVFARVSARGNASELPIAQPRAAVYHLRGGRVVRYVAYWDRYRALTELGLEE